MENQTNKEIYRIIKNKHLENYVVSDTLSWFVHVNRMASDKW